MNKIIIHQKDSNLEVVSKIMNSVCLQYDCNVSYDADTGTVNYSGDEEFKQFIVEETLNYFSSKR